MDSRIPPWYTQVIRAVLGLLAAVAIYLLPLILRSGRVDVAIYAAALILASFLYFIKSMKKYPVLPPKAPPGLSTRQLVLIVILLPFACIVFIVACTAVLILTGVDIEPPSWLSQ